MKANTLLSLSFLATSLALPILRPTAAPAPQKAKRQIGVSILSSHTLSGADHEEHDSLAQAAAAATGVVLGVDGGATTSTTAETTTETSSSTAESKETESSSSEEKNTATETSTTEENSATETSTSEESKETKKSNEKSSSSDNTGNRSSEQDLVVLNFANTLEKLESQFYEQGLKKFSVDDMVSAGLSRAQANIIVETLKVQQKDEATHQAALEATIKAVGGEVNNACSFDFSAGLKDAPTFIATARTLELVGVSAYSGGAQLIENPSILEAAASILPIEARHSTLLNLFAGGNAVPSAFDIPLTPNSILAMASGFLKDCTAEDLGLTSNVPLSVVEQEHGTTLIQRDSTLAFESDALNADTDAKNTFCQMLVGGASEALVFPIDECKVPSDISGPVMVFVTNDKTPLAGDAATQDQSTIVAGPAPVFVDATPQSFEQIFAVNGLSLQTLAATGGNVKNRNNNDRNRNNNDRNRNSKNNDNNKHDNNRNNNKHDNNRNNNKHDNNRNNNKHDNNRNNNKHENYDNSRNRYNNNSHDDSKNRSNDHKSNSYNSNDRGNSYKSEHDSKDSRNSEHKSSDSSSYVKRSPSIFGVRIVGWH